MLVKLVLIIHFLAFSAGIGLAIAGTILRKVAGSGSPENAAILMPLGGRFGRVSRGCVVLLWLSGLALLGLVHGFDLSGLGLWFWLKMLAVLVLTGAVTMIFLAERKIAAGDASARAMIPRYARIAGPAAMVAVVLAILAFSGD